MLFDGSFDVVRGVAQAARGNYSVGLGARSECYFDEKMVTDGRRFGVGRGGTVRLRTTRGPEVGIPNYQADSIGSCVDRCNDATGYASRHSDP